MNYDARLGQDGSESAGQQIRTSIASISGPPPVPFALAVGVTGHRIDMLPEGSVPLLRERIRDVLKQIEAAGRALLLAERDCFAAFEPRMRFVSPVADGADQIAAEVALELGWELQAILPFERQAYRDSSRLPMPEVDLTSSSSEPAAFSSFPAMPPMGLMPMS